MTKNGLISVWSRSPVAAAVDSVAAFTLKRSLVSIVLFPDAAKFSVQELCSMSESPKNSLFGSMKGLLSDVVGDPAGDLIEIMVVDR